MSMKLKTLEQRLQRLDGFEKPKVLLEQYETPPHIASCMAHTIQGSFEDIEGKNICDLGAGCGMLSCSAALLEAALVTGFEIDPEALDIFLQNTDEIETTNVEAVCCDIFSTSIDGFSKTFDTVIMNPPFGTKNNVGMDMKFLQLASKLSSHSIYSLHKTSTRQYIMKKAKELKLESQVVAELRYDLPSSYKFHKKNSVDICVDFWRFKLTD